MGKFLLLFVAVFAIRDILKLVSQVSYFVSAPISKYKNWCVVIISPVVIGEY